jgi:hypothetical protein
MSSRHPPKSYAQIRDLLLPHIARAVAVVLSILHDPKARNTDRLLAATIISDLAVGKPRQTDAKLTDEVSPETRAKAEEARQAMIRMLDDYQRALDGEAGPILMLQHQIRQQEERIAELEAELATKPQGD